MAVVQLYSVSVWLSINGDTSTSMVCEKFSNMMYLLDATTCGYSVMGTHVQSLISMA